MKGTLQQKLFRGARRSHYDRLGKEWEVSTYVQLLPKPPVGSGEAALGGDSAVEELY